jgi:hypothetical protein
MPAADQVSNPEEPSRERVGLVRDHLKDVLASNAFAGSKRAQEFLQLIVGHALAGGMLSPDYSSPDYSTAIEQFVPVSISAEKPALSRSMFEGKSFPVVWMPQKHKVTARVVAKLFDLTLMPKVEDSRLDFLKLAR